MKNQPPPDGCEPRRLRVTGGFPGYGQQKQGAVSVLVEDLTGCSVHAGSRGTTVYHVMFDHDVMDEATIAALWRALQADPIAWLAAIKAADEAAGNVLRFPDLQSVPERCVQDLAKTLSAAPLCPAPSFPCTFLACSFNAEGELFATAAAVVCHLPHQIDPVPPPP